jgi:hypothetical protein
VAEGHIGVKAKCGSEALSRSAGQRPALLAAGATRARKSGRRGARPYKNGF